MAPKIYLILMLLLLNLAVCEAAVIEVNLNYDNQARIFSFNSSRLLEISLPGGIRADSNYKWVLYSVNDAILGSGNITIPGPIIVERDQEHNIPAQVIYPNSSIITIYMDYNPLLRNLIVHDLTDELLNIDLMQYNRCNLNTACDSNENRVLCPEDCQDSAKDGICHNVEDGLCQEDPDCLSRDPDCIIQEAANTPQEAENTSALPKPGNQTTKATPIPRKTAVKSGLPSSILVPLFIAAIIILLSAIAYYVVQTRKNQP